MSKANTDYGSMVPKDFNEYVDNMIGGYSSRLEKMFFTDRRKTSYLEAIKYNADIIWNEYNIKQDLDPKLALVNTDALNYALLSLHPTNLLKKKKISARSKKAIQKVQKFRNLILLKKYSKKDVKTWLKVATSMNYSGQMCLMSWFLTLTSKITGFKIPGVPKMLIGGRIKEDKKEAMNHLATMKIIAQAMYRKNKWYFFQQYSILKAMHKDLKYMIKKF